MESQNTERDLKPVKPPHGTFSVVEKAKSLHAFRYRETRCYLQTGGSFAILRIENIRFVTELSYKYIKRCLKIPKLIFRGTPSKKTFLGEIRSYECVCPF